MLQYHSCLIPEGADLNNAASFEYGSSLVHHIDQSEIDECKASSEVIDELKQDSITSSGDSELDIRNCVLLVIS